MAYEEPAEGDRSSIRAIIYCLAIFVLSRAILEMIGVGARVFIDLATAPGANPADIRRTAGSISGGPGTRMVSLRHRTRIRCCGENRSAHRRPGELAVLSALPAGVEISRPATGLAPYPAMLIVANIAFAAALPLIWHEVALSLRSKSCGHSRRRLRLRARQLCILIGLQRVAVSSARGVALALARRERWLWAGLLAALATLTRNVGVLLASRL